MTLACELPRPLPFGSSAEWESVNGGSPRGGSPRFVMKAKGQSAFQSPVAPYQALPVQVACLRIGLWECQYVRLLRSTAEADLPLARRRGLW